MSTPPVTLRIIKELSAKNIEYDLHEHAPVKTCLDAAYIRGSKLEEGAKTLVCKTDSGSIIMAVMPAHLRLSLKLLRNFLGQKNVRLCSPDEILEITGLKIGCIPPFGHFWNMPVYMDTAILSLDTVEFSAGSHTHSIRMARESLLKIVPHTLADIAQAS